MDLENHMPSEFFKFPSPHRFDLERAVSNPRHTSGSSPDVEETGIVPARIRRWERLNYLFRKSGVYVQRTHSTMRMYHDGAILLTASPPGCLRHLFQICRIQFTSVSRRLCICICIPNSFRTHLSNILSFPFPPLPYHTDDVSLLPLPTPNFLFTG